MEDNVGRYKRIKIWMAACLVIVAFLIDGIQALFTLLVIGVVLNPVISVGADFLFWLWFQLLGISTISNPKKFFVMLAQAIGESISGVDALPLLTAGVIGIILLTWAEDSGGIIGKVANVAETAASGGLKKVT